MTRDLLRKYSERYMSDDSYDYISVIRENYALHYKAACKPNPPRRSVERMEYIANEAIKQRMLRS